MVPACVRPSRQDRVHINIISQPPPLQPLQNRHLPVAVLLKCTSLCLSAVTSTAAYPILHLSPPLPRPWTSPLTRHNDTERHLPFSCMFDSCASGHCTYPSQSPTSNPNIDILVSRFTQLETSAIPHIYSTSNERMSPQPRLPHRLEVFPRDTCVTVLAQAAPYSPSPVHIWTRSRHVFRISLSSLSLARARALPLTSPNGHHIKSFFSPYRPDKGCERMGWRKTGPIEVGVMALGWGSSLIDGREGGKEGKGERAMVCWTSSRFSSRLHPT